MEQVRRLPVIQPADVRGRFKNARTATFGILLAVWAALPWVHIRGEPAVFLDVAARRFFLFGASFNAQDAWLLFFLLTAVGFGLFLATALVGRAWCGWTCPQTVFLEAVFRRVERLLQGPRETRIRRNQGLWTFERLGRVGATHALYLAAAFVVAHVFLSYFVSLPRELEMVRARPGEHPEAFAWAVGMTALFYANFAFFREKLCTTVCPYGRLQGVLLDDDSIVVGYDAARGEPRGKARDAQAGACVDCKRCVVVCPTGIDIRDGLQLECIACTACIDACDAIMDRLGRPRGLVRYDSLNGLAGKRRRFFRPRLVLYAALLGGGAVAAALAVRRHTDFEATLLRAPGAPYVIGAGTVTNAFDLHLVNKRSSSETFRVALDAGPEVTAMVAEPDVHLSGMAGAHVPIVLSVPVERFRADFTVNLRVEREGAPRRDELLVAARFVGASR
jgi:cytochrome c oxidase accessory protein FixG